MLNGLKVAVCEVRSDVNDVTTELRSNASQMHADTVQRVSKITKLTITLKSASSLVNMQYP
jgi:hypothetical protein